MNIIRSPTGKVIRKSKNRNRSDQNIKGEKK